MKYYLPLMIALMTLQAVLMIREIDLQKKRTEDYKKRYEMLLEKQPIPEWPNIDALGRSQKTTSIQFSISDIDALNLNSYDCNDPRVLCSDKGPTVGEILDRNKK